MKTLRYLLSMIAVVSVMGVSAQTPQYGKSYKNPYSQAGYYVQVNEQLPAATIGSANSEFVHSGSNLPMAAATGTYTTYDTPSGPRRIGGGNSGGGDGPTNPDDPWATPIGDAAIPLVLCALAYLIMRVVRRRTRALSRSLRDVK